MKKWRQGFSAYLPSFLLIIFFASCLVKKEPISSGPQVTFPLIEGPTQITYGDKEHFFASYYTINSFSENGRYATVLQTDVKYKIPDETKPATLGLVDLESYEYIPLVETKAWNFQEGCMAHWLASSPDSLIIYNDLRDGKYVSVILNVHSKKEIKVIPHPVSGVSPNGREAVSLNFARLRHTRADYGYGGEGQDAKLDVQFPEDDGLFLIDLATGDSKLICSMARVRELVPELPPDGIEYFAHTLFSDGGTKIFWLARAIPERNTTCFTINRDGSNLQASFSAGWGGSHFSWLNDDELMVTAIYDAKIYGHILYTVGQQNYRRLGNGLLDYDGHGNFSPDGKWMITDTYPAQGSREQRIYLMDMATEAVLPLGRFPQPEEYTSGWRCDIHCRWSDDGRLVGFNSTHTGSRQAYLYKFQY